MGNIADIKVTDTKLEILHPKTNELLGLRLTLMSLDDDRMKAIRRSISDARLHLEARQKHFKTEEIEENSMRLAVGVVTAWEWYAPEGGEQATFNDATPDFSKAKLREVMTELPWIRKQVLKELDEETHFFQS